MTDEIRKPETRLKRFTQEQIDRMGPKQIIGLCQDLFGCIGTAANDRNTNRAFDLQEIEKTGMDLCIKARARWNARRP